MCRLVSVLFARADSIYKELPDCDVWDKERNAMLCDDPYPIVAHPPCRAWGRLAHMANPELGERNLARLAVALVRRNGGVLEHPQGSRLWADQGLPIPGSRDQFGGWTLPVDQRWWGHRANKATWLYVCGCRPRATPDIPYDMSEGTHYIARDNRAGVQSRNKGKIRLPAAEREHTPPDFARWLVQLARLCAR